MKTHGTAKEIIEHCRYHKIYTPAEIYKISVLHKNFEGLTKDKKVHFCDGSYLKITMLDLMKTFRSNQ